MRLDELAEKYVTDKRGREHNYTLFYENYFESLRENKNKILEIGIYRPPLNSGREVGASLKMWYEYFPKSEIYGVDLTDFTDVDNDRIKTTICNQEIREDSIEYPGLNSIIKKFGGDFDIIIEDGGHTMDQQLITLGYMFKFLKPGGIFVIEDLHTSRMSAYNKNSTTNTTLKVLQNFQLTNEIHSEYILSEELTYLNNNIKNCEIKNGTISEICFITKK